jgi:hypothetical protein
MDILKKYNKDAANENDSRVELFKSLDTDKIVYKNKYGILTTLNNETIEPIIPDTKIDGTSFILVKGEGTAAENAAELQAAYDLAKTMSPSITNRITVIAAPGYYNFGDINFTMDTQYIDLVSLDGNRSIVFNSPAPFSDGRIRIDANDVFVKGVDLGSKPFGVVSPVTNLLKIEKCRGGDYSFGINGGTLSGTFIDCVGGDYSFAGASFGTASGIFTNCVGGEQSFGGFGTASGTFIDCVGGEQSFGAQGIASGTFINCVGGSNAFGGFGVASGTFTNCVGGFVSFGYNGPASGTFTDCKGGYLAFGGGGTASGIFTNCVGDDLAFGGMGTLNGKLYYCRLTSGTFPTVSGGGITRYCLDGTNTANNQG